jgi:hypothetical protein
MLDIFYILHFYQYLNPWPGKITCNQPRGSSTLPCEAMAHSHKYIYIHGVVVFRKSVKRIGVFVHTHSDPDSGDLHARTGAACTPDNVSILFIIYNRYCFCVDDSGIK